MLKSAGISKKERDATEAFIKANSGKTDAFKANNIAYANSAEIESSADTRQGMVDIVNQDKGNGGTSDANNREYGGRIKRDGTVVEETPGEVAVPGVDDKATIAITTYFKDQVTFHSHQSGIKVDGKTTSGYHQAPSNTDGDIERGNNSREYVFGRGNGTVYIYNNKGVQATIPQKYFVIPNKK